MSCYLSTNLTPPEVPVECPTCQTTAVDGARFCANCGAVIPVPPDTTGEVPVPADATAVLSPVPATPDAVPEPVGATGELRTCPACGAANSAARVLCARCGVDLDSGTRPRAAPVVHRPGPSIDIVGEVGSGPARRGTRTAAIVAAIVVVGAVLGVVAGLWLIGSREEPEAAAPVFDPGVYVGEPEPLTVSRVGASSERPATGDVTYAAPNLVDDDLGTSWSHDPAIEDVTDVDLVFVLADPAWVTTLTFANGAQADDLAFAADGRVVRLALLVDGEPAVELQLLDRQGLQQVTLPAPRLLTEVRLLVLDAVSGDTYDDVSLSEVMVTGHTARGEDLARVVAG